MTPDFICPYTDESFTFGITKVFLSDRPGFAPMETYPVKGSDFECEGLVIGPGNAPNFLRVEWDNGHVKPYRSKHLDVITEPTGTRNSNPNVAFRNFKNRKQKQLASMEIDDIKKIMTATGATFSSAVLSYRLSGGNIAKAIKITRDRYEDY